MKIISLTDNAKKIEGVAVKICLDDTLTFTRYGVNENGIYESETILEGIEFDDPSYNFANINKPLKTLEGLKRTALRKIAEKYFPSLKVLYLEA